MFGISFGELLLIGLIALLVLGPERLPGAARTAGLWVGRLKRSFNAIKQDVEREIGADEIRRQLHNENVMELHSKSKAASASAADASTPMTAFETPAAPIIEPPQPPRAL
ncbi:MAG: Sec-independent protein translocase subunit TatB [Pseudomonas sp.]|nr:Sec-independent protein translocase subunit TatB [Pseudomonas sp.]